MDAPQPAFVLLVPAGLQHVAAAALELEAGLPTAAVPPPELPPGFAAGAAGGIGLLLAGTMAGTRGSGNDAAGVVCAAQLLPERVLRSPCLAAALAVVVHQPALDASSAAEVAACMQPSCWAAAVDSLGRHASWAVGAADADDAGLRVARSFRVASLRGGRHAFSSRDVDKAVAGVVSRHQPGWSVSLDDPDVLVLCVVLQVGARATRPNGMPHRVWSCHLDRFTDPRARAAAVCADRAGAATVRQPARTRAARRAAELAVRWARPPTYEPLTGRGAGATCRGVGWRDGAARATGHLVILLQFHSPGAAD